MGDSQYKWATCQCIKSLSINCRKENIILFEKSKEYLVKIFKGGEFKVCGDEFIYHCFGHQFNKNFKYCKDKGVEK